MDRRAVEAAAALGMTPRRTLTKVRIFSVNWKQGLQEAINDWLEAQPADFRLVDIKYNSYPTEPYGKNQHNAMIIYTVLEPLE